MFRKALLGLAFLTIASRAQAYTLQFQPTLEVWKCPPGASYVILQCTQLMQKALPTVTLTLMASDETDPAYVADWTQSVTAPGEPASYANMGVLKYHDEKGNPFIGFSAAAGWSTDQERNSSMYFDITNGVIPQTLMISSERLSKGDYELETDLQLIDVKLTK